MRHLIKKLLPSVAVALTVTSSSLPLPARAQTYPIDCAILLCLSGGWPASVPCARARTEFIRRITPWPVEPPLQIWRCPMGASYENDWHQTTLAASLKPCTRRTTFELSNPCQSTISFPPTRPSCGFRIAQTSISADQSSISCVPSASSMYGMPDSTSLGAMVIATEARPWFSAPMGLKAISLGRGLPSLPFLRLT